MWKSFLCAFVTFLIAVTKHLKRSDVKEEGFLLAHVEGEHSITAPAATGSQLVTCTLNQSINRK